MARRILEKKGW